MRTKYNPQPTNIYVNHYMRGGSSIGEYFRAYGPYQYGGGVISTLRKIAIPLFKNVVKPAIKHGLKKAVPIIKHEGSQILKSGLRDLSDVIRKKSTAKEMIKKNKKIIRKRVADIIDSQINPKRQRKDIFDV